MVNIKKKPALDVTDAQDLATRYYDLDCVAEELVSERDQNFLLFGSDGQKYVLKIANPSENPLVLAFENRVLAHVSKIDPEIPIPRLIQSISDSVMEKETGGNGEEYLIRLITYLPGRPMALAKPHVEALLWDLGHMLSCLDRAMVGLRDPVALRPLTWALPQAAGVVRAHASSVENWKNRRIVEHFLARFETFALPLLPSLPHGLIHNDANDYNILVVEQDSGEVVLSGLLDFGDLIWGPTIYEPAVAAAYAILDEPDPVTIAGHILGGYHANSELSREEVEIFLELITIRLCTSVVLSAHQRKIMPDNEYLSISERGAWESLFKLIALDPAEVREHFLVACHYESGERQLD